MSENPYSFFREGADLMKRALAGSVERIPVYAQIHEFVASRKGIPNKVFYTQADERVSAMLEVQAEFGLDVASINHDVYNIEAEGIGQPLILSDECMPDIDRSRMLIREKDDLAKIKTPDFDRAGRFGNVVAMYQKFKDLTGLEPGIGFTAPFSMAANIRGIEQLITDFYTDPGFAGLLMEKVTRDVLAPYIYYLHSKFPGVKRYNGADATASIPIVNYRLLEKWCAPYILMLREITGLDVFVANWVGERYLKDPMPMLELKLKVASGSIQGQDPDVAALGPEFYKNFAERADVPLILGVGASFLAQASPVEVISRVKNYIEIGARNGRFALYLCNVSGATPPENLSAAIETAHAYPENITRA
jgi:hypothetical protein